MTDVVALGVDWYRRGWVGVVLRPSTAPAVVVDSELERLIARVSDAACVGVDMPIGLPTAQREADALARAFVGPRRSSVFMTPPQQLLDAASYPEANRIARDLLGGKGISQQAWAVRHNIEVVARVAQADSRVIEVHPEVSFCAMRGQHLAYAKGTWNGQALRRRCLAAQGIELPEDLEEGGDVPVADVLDAAAVAWTARRYALKRTQSLPEGAQQGQQDVIWY